MIEMKRRLALLQAEYRDLNAKFMVIREKICAGELTAAEGCDFMNHQSQIVRGYAELMACVEEVYHSSEELKALFAEIEQEFAEIDDEEVKND